MAPRWLSTPPPLMDFAFSIFFLFLYYIRPQDWVPGMAGFNIMRPLTVLWLAALFFARSRSQVPGILRTPHDWLMLIYLAYIVWNSPDSQGAFSGVLPLFVFYALTVRTLHTWDRVLGFLKGWNFMLLGIAAIAVASLYNLDFTGAAELTAINENRLCIGTWLHNNPNALGHSVVAAIPLSYLLYFWRGNAVGRLVIFPLCAALAGWCAYKTESKGAFLVAGALMVVIFVIGRPLPVKVLALAIAATVGVSALTFLPRMEKMANLRADDGVQGRLMAWELAQTAMETHTTGVGWKNFTAIITWFGQTVPKATHASYVQVGADLGVYGIFLFVAALWASFHTLFVAHKYTLNDDGKERCRRATMAVLAAYVISSWMINREYHTEYFLVIAVAAAVHRLCLFEISQEADTETADNSDNKTPVDATPRLILSTVDERLGTRPHLVIAAVETPADSPPQRFWHRFGILDLAASATLTWGVLYIWEYVLKNL